MSRRWRCRSSPTSPVLTDADLVELIRHGSARKQEAIAGRADVSEQIADALVTTGQRGRSRRADGQRRGADRRGQPRHRHRPLRRQRPRQGEHGAPRRPAGDDRRAPGRDGVRTSCNPIWSAITNCRSRWPPTSCCKAASAPRCTSASAPASRSWNGWCGRCTATQRLTPFLVLRALCLGDLAFFEMAMAVMAKVPVSQCAHPDPRRRAERACLAV